MLAAKSAVADLAARANKAVTGILRAEFRQMYGD
jgi:hypothetical protein